MQAIDNEFMLITVRNLGIQEYTEIWKAMQLFTDTRNQTTPDEIWVLQHYPVYTQGLSRKPGNILDAEAIPVIESDRGGQCTYHGPGQLVIYTLIDLRRKNLGIRTLVSSLENAVILTLQQYGISSSSNQTAPGVYVNDRKIASVGLRVRRGCTYHGLSLNVAMDLSPFDGILTCGYPDLEVTQLADLRGPENPVEISLPLIKHLMALLNYDGIIQPDPPESVKIA